MRAVTIYFRPRGGQEFKKVKLQLNDPYVVPSSVAVCFCSRKPLPSEGTPYWFKPNQPGATDEDIAYQDVAILPLVMLDGKPTTFPKPHPGQDPRSRSPSDSDEVACAGFPLLSVEEHGKWDFRKPCNLRGNIVVDYPHLRQFRVAMPAMWGMSGSLVYSRPQEGEGIIPRGVFSHIHFIPGATQRDSGIRRVWDWKIVEDMLEVIPGTHELQVVWVGE
jgi:hypothetical protein